MRAGRSNRPNPIVFLKGFSVANAGRAPEEAISLLIKEVVRMNMNSIQNQIKALKHMANKYPDQAHKMQARIQYLISFTQ